MAIQDQLDTPLARAVRAMGGQSAMARLIGKHQTTISERLHSGLPLWPEDVLAVEAATGISRHQLRPDIYPIESGEDGPRQPPADNLPPSAGGSSSAGDALEGVRA